MIKNPLKKLGATNQVAIPTYTERHLFCLLWYIGNRAYLR